MGGIFSIVSAKNKGLGCCPMVGYWSSMNGTLSSGSSIKRKEERKGRGREGEREERGSEKRRGKGRMKERGRGNKGYLTVEYFQQSISVRNTFQRKQ